MTNSYWDTTGSTPLIDVIVAQEMLARFGVELSGPIGSRVIPHLGCSTCGQLLERVQAFTHLPGLYCSEACVRKAAVV